MKFLSRFDCLFN